MLREPAARKRRSGSVMIWLVVSLGVVVAVIALGLDGGRMMEERRRAQSAADDAAYAAATDLYFNYSQNQGTDPQGTAKSTALASAATNGYSNDGTTSVVTVNIPPQSGTFAGKSDYVEVIVQSNLQGSFSAAFTSGTMPVKARAVARGRPQPIGVLLLGSGTALSLTGNTSVQVTGPLTLNSTDSSSISLVGNAGVSASELDLAGSAPSGLNVSVNVGSLGVNANLSLGGGISLSGSLNTNVSPTPDPFSAMSVPSGGASSTAITVTGSTSLQPGSYGNISVSGTGSLTLAPGSYLINGLSVSGNGSVSGQGVTLFNLGGSISLSGTGTINLTPPTTGTYQGISIFQPSSVASSVSMSGTGSMQITGIVYAPSATIQIIGDGGFGNTLGGGFVASSIQAFGNASFNISQGNVQPRVPQIQLVE